MNRFCPKCGFMLGAAETCPKCGTAVASAYASPQPAVSAATAPAAAPNHEKKKNPHLVLIIVIISAVVLLSILCLILFFGKCSGRSRGSSAEIPERPAAEEYLSEIGGITGRKGAKSVRLLTESEALKEYEARGFTGVTVTACYDENGKLTGEQEITGGRGKHPYYEAYYRDTSDVLWNIILMGDSFYAEPMEYNSRMTWRVPHTFSETGDFVSYDGAENAFFTVTPDPEVLVVTRLSRISAETIDFLNTGEVK